MNQYQLIVLFEVLAHASMLNYASPVQLCGKELTEALKSICGERGYYSPGQSFSRRAPTHDGIATRCCQSLCESSILETYCNLPATSQTQTPSAAPTKMAPLTEDRRTKEVVVDYSDQPVIEASQMSRVDGALTQEVVTNRSKLTTTESNEGSYDTEEGAPYGKTDDNSPSERGESIQDEDNEVNKQEPTNIRDNSKERGRNRTHKGLSSERRANSSRRKGLSSERRGSSSNRREAKLRRRRQRHRERELREQRKQSNSKRKSKGDKKDHSGAVTTPLAVQEPIRPLKNGARNITSGEHSLVNQTETDTAGSQEVKKDDLITTITAVLSDMIGFQPDNGNR